MQYRSLEEADGMMLAKVTQAFTLDIVEKEQVRRRRERKLLYFVKYELPSAGEGRKIRAALYAFDILDSSPTCDLLCFVGNNPLSSQLSRMGFLGSHEISTNGSGGQT